MEFPTRVFRKRAIREKTEKQKIEKVDACFKMGGSH